MMLRLLHAAVRVYRRLPFPRVKRLVHRGWARYEARQARTVTATIDGITYELHLGELIDSNLYYRGSFEPETAAALARLVAPGDVVLDIGANIGCHALRMAKLVGREGRVFAFEPMPWARGKLQRNLSLNAFDNVTVVGRALSDEAGKQELHFRSSWALGAKSSSGRSTEAPESAGAHLIELQRLDDFLAEAGVSRVSFIKLDVDGFEHKVLRGARQTLEAYRPVILTELVAYTLAAAGDDIRQMVQYLSDLGYRFYREDTLEAFPSTEAMLALVPPDGGINVVASTRPLC